MYLWWHQQHPYPLVLLPQKLRLVASFLLGFHLVLVLSSLDFCCFGWDLDFPIFGSCFGSDSMIGGFISMRAILYLMFFWPTLKTSTNIFSTFPCVVFLIILAPRNAFIYGLGLWLSPFCRPMVQFIRNWIPFVQNLLHLFSLFVLDFF